VSDENLTYVVQIVIRITEIAGIIVIVAGAASAFVRFVSRVRRTLLGNEIADLRSSLGRSILLGLELLVAADIISTVALEPTLESLAILAGVVLIRTFLSFSLEVEIEGQWPWQRQRSQKPATSETP
jgi:uncharacterized membrane protein